MLKHHPRLRADLVLFLVALIWGSAFAAQRVGAQYLGFFAYNGSRFFLGAITVYLITRLRRERIRRALTRVELLGGLVGSLIILGGSSFQQAGLHYTTAGKAGFITGLYVVAVPILIAAGRALRKPAAGTSSPLGWTTWLASLLAGVGLYLLSAIGPFSFAYGDLIELAGTLFWALHILLIGYLANQVDTLRLAFVQYLACALLNLGLGLLFEPQTLAGLLPAWWSIFYVGVFSVGLAYTMQVEGQKQAPEADAAVILSLEAVFAALFGWLILGETLTLIQLLGCGLMMSGMLLVQLRRGGAH